MIEKLDVPNWVCWNQNRNTVIIARIVLLKLLEWGVSDEEAGARERLYCRNTRMNTSSKQGG